MKRIVLAACLLGSFFGSALAQQPISQMPRPAATPALIAASIVAMPQPCATIYHADAAPRVIYAAAPVTPETKADAVRRALKLIVAGDLLQLGYGDFEFGKDKNVACPDIEVRGMGRDHTRLKSEVVSDNSGTSFALGNTTLEDLSLTNDCSDPNEDGRCVGFDGGPFKATLRGCNVWCRDWAWYNWSPGNQITIENCVFTFGRQGIAGQNSGVGQNVDVYHSRFYGDATLSKSVGATSNRDFGGLFGVVHRGGRLRMFDCRIELTGAPTPGVKADGTAYSFCPWTCGVTDFFADGPAGNTQIELWNLSCSVSTNGGDATKTGDVRITQPYVKLRTVGGGGSAGDGGFSKPTASPTPHPGA